jgi:crotonobetainyl-CoA:carnitine CoA-transferase CaiB-like acyl-CoA transferase
MNKQQKRGGPLEGIRVVELTKVWAGPYAGKLLAFLGAEVIRIESEGSLDVTRTYGVSDLNKAPGFQAVNPQKLSVQVNMKSEEGIKLILDLLKESDILIENLRPGAVDRLGLGYQEVKKHCPKLIYTSMGMYGAEGPLSYQTGYAPCFAALGGLSALAGYEGEAPSGVNIRYADSTFGASAALACVAALNHRSKTGEGQFIDVSAVESMTSMIGDAVMDFTLNGAVRECDGNRHEDMAPHGVYPCRDSEWICIAIPDEARWQTFSASLGLEGTHFQHLAERLENAAELDQLIANWTATQDASELATALQAQSIPASKSASSVDLISDYHLWGREFFPEVKDSEGDSRPIVGPGWKMSRGAVISNAAPKLGEHNSYVFGELLGLSVEEQQRLSEAGITR